MLSNIYKRALTGIKMLMLTNGFKQAFSGAVPTLYQHNKTYAKKYVHQYDMYFEVANLRLGRSGEKPHG
jgi:hypothetical protein